jgi:hypothetical protein
MPLLPLPAPRARRRTALPHLERLESRVAPAGLDPPPGLVSWWPGDDDAHDIVGHNDGALAQGAGFSQGEVADGFTFDGVNGLVQAPTTGLPTGQADRTIELWARIDNQVAGEAFFASYGNPGSFGQVYTLGTRSDGTLFVSTWGPDVNGPKLENGRWYHVAATNVGTSFKLYLDGVEVASGDMALDTPAGSTFWMGREGPGSIGDFRRLDGMVDEVSVYNRALRPDEIQAIYQAGPDGKIKPYMAVTGSTPAEGETVFAPPTSFTTHFSHPFDPATLDAGDLTVNGVPADSVTALAPDVAEFDFAASPVTASGAQTMSMAAGSVSASGGADPLLRAWSATFTYVRGAGISGQAFADLTVNGAPDAGKPGLEGWTVYADLNDNGVLDGGEPSATTAAQGRYLLDNLDPGTYTIREVREAGWGPSLPAGGAYGTYLPGTVNNGLPGTVNNGSDVASGYVSAIAVDGSGNIYADGAAQAGFPTTAGASQATYGGSTDAFFAKIDPALSGTASLIYSSYFGGSGGAAATGIALDGAGTVYLEGYTTSLGISSSKLFVAKIDPALSGAASLVYSTYLGGTTNLYGGSGTSGYVGNEPGLAGLPQIDGGIAVDSAGNAYVTSATTQTDFPTTVGAYQTTFNNAKGGEVQPCDVVVLKLNATGSLVYSTYLGGGTVNRQGTSSSGGASIAVDASGDAYVTGWTDSTTFPTKNPLQATNGDAGAFDGWGNGMDSFVTELNPSGSGILFSTYLGSSHEDYDGYGIALDSAGNVYVGGGIDPANQDNWQKIGFAAKIDLAPSPSFAVSGFPSSTTAGVSHTFTVTALNANGTVNTGYTGTIHISSSDPQAVLPADYTFTAADQGAHTFNATLGTAGSQSITVTDTSNGTLIGSESGIVVQPAAATKFVLGAPSSVTSGQKFSVTLTVEDAFGNIVTGYTGTAHFSSSDGTATLPRDYTFKASDAGVHTFTGLVLRKRGNQTLTVTDTQNSSLTATDSITVS